MTIKTIFRPFFNILFKIKVSKNKSTIAMGTRVSRQTYLEGHNKILRSDISSSKIGFGTYIQRDTSLPHSRIGRFCSIGKNVKVVYWTHPSNNISTYPGFYKSVSNPPFVANSSLKYDERLRTPNNFTVEVGNDCWIGDNVLIKGGVTIGDGVIVGMGSVVTKDVPPYAIVCGNPAIIVKYRFEKEMISKLLKVKWWNWNIKDIEDRSNHFDDIEYFLANY